MPPITALVVALPPAAPDPDGDVGALAPQPAAMARRAAYEPSCISLARTAGRIVVVRIGLERAKHGPVPPPLRFGAIAPQTRIPTNDWENPAQSGECRNRATSSGGPTTGLGYTAVSMVPAMTFAAVVGVKDEVELIGPSVRHLRRIGVDRIIVCDVGSTDGTLDVLEAERRLGGLDVTHVDPAVVVDYESASRHDLALAKESGADWVLFLDADEFVLPRTGRLRDSRDLMHAGVIVMDRFNVMVPAPVGIGGYVAPVMCPIGYDKLLLLTNRVDPLTPTLGPSRMKQYLADNPDVPMITVAAGPKVLARPASLRGVSPGGHDVETAPGTERVIATDLIVAHVAFSTLARFERKVTNIRAEIEKHPAFFAGDYAWHWRQWSEMTAPGAIAAEFERQLADESTLRRWRREGIVQSAAEIFQALAEE